MKTISNSAGRIRFDIGELKALARGIKASRNMRARVGIFAAKATRAEEADGINNATLGAIHEFGSRTRAVGPKIFGHAGIVKAGPIPARSWLRMPITLYLRPYVEGKGRAFWKSSLSTKGMATTLKKLGQAAEEIIQQAFETGGFGHWKKLARATIRRKGSEAILIDKAVFRKSIASKVVTK